ncbi:hypothetical protein OQA88_6261 [Cercophora sp. LCS_1]
MAMGGGIVDFVHRFQQIQSQRHSSEQLIEDILVYVENVDSTLRNENNQLASQLRDSDLDLADARNSRREFQQKLQAAESTNETLLAQIAQLKAQISQVKLHNPYILVLIDGDGLLFGEQYVRLGLEGGKQAAYALRTAILNECGQHAVGVEVIAKVYVNLSGLAKAMRRDGCLDNEADFKDFSLGFTQGKATFDFIDVGHGKERADNKVKETARWHLRNVNCKQVLLGISHDAGYAPFLDELFQDNGTKQLVTVLEGFPTVRELKDTGVRVLALDETLFRNDKLADRAYHGNGLVTAFGAIGAAAVTNVSTLTATATAAAAAAATIVKTASPATSSSSTPISAPASSYARAITSASPPPQITLPLQPRPVNAATRPQPPKPAPWNPGPRGLDPPLQVSQTALDSIKKRKDSNKLCNNHYLRGPCSKGDTCCFEHKYKPNKDEITAIAFLTRLNPCEHGQECDVENCIYGHHCPSVRDGYCTHPYCKFELEDHPPGTRFRSNNRSH